MSRIKLSRILLVRNIQTIFQTDPWLTIIISIE